jgi:hypothetical protein
MLSDEVYCCVNGAIFNTEEMKMQQYLKLVSEKNYDPHAIAIRDLYLLNAN